jgi:hypothetical protein
MVNSTRFRFYKSHSKLLACRSCRGWQLLLPVTAKVTQNAFALAKPLGASAVHSHNYLAKNAA